MLSGGTRLVGPVGLGKSVAPTRVRKTRPPGSGSKPHQPTDPRPLRASFLHWQDTRPISAETWFDSGTKQQLGPVASRVGQRLFNPQNRMGSTPSRSSMSRRNVGWRRNATSRTARQPGSDHRNADPTAACQQRPQSRWRMARWLPPESGIFDEKQPINSLRSPRSDATRS